PGEAFKLQAVPLQEAVDGGTQSVADDAGKFRPQYHAEAVVLDVQAQNVLGSRPAVIADRADAWQTRVARRRKSPAWAIQHNACRTVGKQGSGYEVTEARIIGARTQRCQLNGEKQNVGAGIGLGQLRSSGKPSSPTPTPKAEDGHPPDRPTELDP